eukprot:TRINITY_DN8378_c0_g2_i2.p1 TRINITY_DN8378_c0_g2~~TRINITY_DN8378_c0_g2_i2.p1  ORF type:complete len:388 (+),score=69.46 TRINITY_DN8378_c0_g2_i2:151-1314(+)
MCASTTISPTSPINYHGTDEDSLMQLKRILLMSPGAPFPSNVIENSPFNVEPWDLPDSFWYLLGKGTNKSTEAGYWKSIGSIDIFSNSTQGTKTIREFHTRLGWRTDWLMHEYKMDHTEDHQFNMAQNLQDYNSLCKIFRNRGQSSNHERAAVDEADDDLIYSMFDIIDFGEMNRSSQDSINISEVVSRDERNLENQRTNELYDSKTGGFLELKDLIGEPSDFETGGFMELDDLNDNESYMSSSVDSSCPSVTSDEYFNTSAMLRELQSSNNDSDRAKMHMDHKFIAPASAIPNQMVIKPPTSASLHSNSSSKKKNKEAMVESASIPAAVCSASTIKLQPNKVASKPVSGTCNASEANRGSPTSSTGGGKAIGRIAKLGRFFCLSCF